MQHAQVAGPKSFLVPSPEVVVGVPDESHTLCWRTCEGDGHPHSAKGEGGAATKTISSVAANGRITSSLSSSLFLSAMQLKPLPETPEQAMPAVETTEGEQEDMLG